VKDMQKMMKQAQQMAAEMQKAQDELADIEVEGSAGGGAVKVVASADQKVLRVTLDPDLLSEVEEDDIEMISDTIVAAVNDALEKAREKQAEALGPIAGGLGGLGLPGV
jgi:DNA-binding YbaB/EbfC family protein